MVREENYDVVIVGCGVGGLYTALNLPSEDRILMICKEDIESCDSMLAQGGICVLRDETDYDAYFEDTMRAGHYENRKESVDIMIRSSRDVINNLKLGVGFDKNPDGSLKYTKEGAHSQPRICFHEDITGKEITTTLQTRVKELPNVEIREYTVMTDILVENGICTGILGSDHSADPFRLKAERSADLRIRYAGILHTSESCAGCALRRKYCANHQNQYAGSPWTGLHPYSKSKRSYTLGSYYETCTEKRHDSDCYTGRNGFWLHADWFYAD